MFRPLLLVLATLPSFAIVRQVGPGKTYAAPCAAIAASSPGDTIEIDAGNYAGDVCAWSTSGLTIRGIGGRAAIDAAGRNAQGKAIWVIAGNDTTIESIEFSGAHVIDRNGAGIRQEGANLTLRYCYFHDNDEGILSAPNPASRILIEFSEFAYNGFGDGLSHNIYIGGAASFTLRFSYSHHSWIGHLVKSRAVENHILYNRLSDEAPGTGSYELDLPNGGTSYVIGNLIEQGPNTNNSAVIEYGLEGLTNPGKDLYVVNNTFVNDRPAGALFVMTNTTIPVVIKNNIFAGPGAITNQTGAVLAGNLTGVDPLFADRLNYDYRLQAGSPAVNAGVDPGQILMPLYQYMHPACGQARLAIGAIDIGAWELGGGGALAACAGASLPASPSLSSMTLSRRSVKGGSRLSGTVVLSQPAPSGGVIVRLSSSAPGVASVPATVTVGAGRREAGFPVQTSRVAYSTTVRISAAFGGAVKEADLTVLPRRD